VTAFTPKQLFEFLQSRKWKWNLISRDHNAFAQDLLKQFSTSNLGEAIWLFIKNKSPKLGECGKRLIFKNLVIKNKLNENPYSYFCERACVCAKKIVKNKIKETNLKKYGVENPMQHTEIKENIKKKNIEKYGVEHLNQIHIPKDQLDILLDKEKFIDICDNKTIKQIQEIVNVDYTTIIKYAHRYNCINLIVKSSSYLEDQIECFCKTNNIKFIRNTRKIIPPLELDFYFPEIKTAIECHGLFWHSEMGGNKDKNYHYNKWRLCKEKGIDLYQYFEDEVNDKFEVIKSKILYLNNKHPGTIIGARCLSVDWLTNGGDEERFYNQNHLQGIRYDRTHAIGAWHNVFNLVAVMSLKLNKDQTQMEIVRFATDISNRYPGVFSKILNWVIEKLNFRGEIVSWSDNRHSNGHLYKSNGFEFVKEQKPGYFVTDYQHRWRREYFMKNRIKERYPEVDLSKTERELTQELGFDWIWDAGKYLWRKIV